MGGETEVTVDLDQALDEESVAGIEGGIVVAAEEAEGGEPDGRGDVLRRQHGGRGGEALFGGAAGPEIQRIDRFAFYDRARSAYAVVMSGETAKYGNIILKKGVTPPFAG